MPTALFSPSSQEIHGGSAGTAVLSNPSLLSEGPKKEISQGTGKH